jgi:hypothetical protein
MSGKIVKLLLIPLFLIIGLIVVVIMVRLPTGNIPVLNKHVEAGTVIAAADVDSLSWPQVATIPNMVLDPAEVIGKTTATSIDPRQPIVTNMLVDPTRTGTNAVVDPHFPYAIKSDLPLIKMFVPVDIRRGDGGAIQPGNYVNVLRVTGPDQGSIILQKIHVVSARGADGHEILLAPITTTPVDPAAPPAAAVVLPAGYLLAVTPAQAVLLAAVDPIQIFLVYTTADAPDLSCSIPSGLPAANCGGAVAPAATPAPSAVPQASPSVAPGVTPLPVVRASQAPAVPSASPTH